jgi:Dynein light chain type 1
MTAEQRKAVIKNADMSESMQQDAVDCASQALAKYNIEKVRNGDSMRLTEMAWP